MDRDILKLLDKSFERLANAVELSKTRVKQRREDARNATEVTKQLEAKARGLLLDLFEYAKDNLVELGLSPELAQEGVDVEVDGNMARTVLRLEFDHPATDDEHSDSPLRAAIVACVENHKLHIVSTVDVGAAGDAFKRHDSWVIDSIAERHHRALALAVKKPLDALGV